MASNGDRGDYGGDEETTPAEPTGPRRVSAESRVFANLGLEYNHVSIGMWNAARLLDALDGDDRSALLAKLIAELSTIIDATTKARASLIIKKAEVIK